jgi:predicted DNA-binding transcriptional regulator AlpA
MATEIETNSETFLKTAQVRQRYGHCSKMWIERRMRDSAFPQPVYFGALRFWRESELLAWERAQIEAPKPRVVREIRKAVHS